MNVRSNWISAGELEALKLVGKKVIRGGIAVFYHEDQVYAVDNRCPHLGFPLHMGSLCNGILTCHWHHARFDVCSGGTLDPWADDVPSYEVRVDGGEVWVNPVSRRVEGAEKYKLRLKEGLEQNIGIVIAKAVVGLIEAGVPEQDIARIGIEFGTTYGTGWNAGLTILTAMAQIVDKLDKNGKILALYQGLVHVARGSSGRGARHLLSALPSSDVPFERLTEWYRNCIEVRDTQGAEKVLMTAVMKGIDTKRLSDMMLAAATDHFYLDGGHVFDFHNKAFEALEWVDVSQRERILTSLVPMMASPTRSEELHQWQAPVNLVEPIKQAISELEQNVAQQVKLADGSRQQTALSVEMEQQLLQQLLSDTPEQTITLLRDLLISGTAPAQLAKIVALAAAERIVRFHTQNDFRDWIAVLHTFTYAHAVHERLLQSDEPHLQRAIFHGAVSVYLDRFLNVPTAARPKSSGSDTPTDHREMLDLLDLRQQVGPAAQWVVDYMHGNGDPAELLNTLGHALLREDAEFHTFQMYEASVAEYKHWQSVTGSFADKAKETMLLACTRYLAAHAPTARELPHTAKIAWRLHKGERLFEEE
ncbi:Rieske 2Fe-2S domain-containing protein [Paenibacillus sp. CGMCC 1.16610]|uniref:Rieske 2Fe-2S domain-containing protein n=1 Tax=Paenibacillus anseongense TaxID=2682845 RepID=A0ABW9UL74_9BACL|nr:MULTISPECIES: Rieske 2Fe-2S domain-containing protein [Paenibacillus]MBA2939588.1 Rieske 2Fe-2S domain-containing protein [Paenibacillus sp. CGMCC 1.16610]MVQ39250.1 Rieske 2Fe-2S domain-containing protein [Paenibacillus anseongense]